MSAGAILAGLLAGVFCLCEYFNASRKAPCLRATGWILALFGFDAAAGLLAYAVLTEVLGEVAWFTGLWPILVAGLCGPALLRSQLALLGSGQESSYYGPATRFRRIQRRVEQRIDQLTADAQSNWIAAKVIPHVALISVGEMELYVTNYAKALNGVEDDRREDMLTYFDVTFADVDRDDNSKRRAVVQKLIDNDCHECIRGLVRRAKKISGSQTTR